MMIFFKFFILLFIIGYISNASAIEIVTDPWKIPIFVITSETSDTAYFGTMIGATDNFETNIDVLAPPQPPSGTYSYFKILDFFDKLSSDFRSNLDSTNTWSLKIIGTSGTSGTISWDNSSFPLGDFPGTLSINGTDMLSNQSISFIGDQNLTIYYKASQKYSGIPITITTIPASLTINVDGTDYISPQIFDWEEGSAHTISALSSQSGGTGIRYIYDFWSDGGDTTHTITVPDIATTYTANFTTQYYLTVNSERGNPQGNGWYDSDSTAIFSVTSPVIEGDSIRYVFLQWSGDYQGSDNPATIQMNSPKSVTANWTTQFKLTTLVIPSEGGNLSLNPDLPWYNSGTNVEITAISAIGYQFSHWSGDVSGIDSTISLVIDTPKKVIVNFLDVTKVKKINDNNFPKNFRLFQNFPNPFNPGTIIKYQIPKSTFVTITIYNNTGQRIEILFSNYQSQGSYTLQWNVGNLSSGMYYIKMESGDFIDIKKCLILK